MKKAVYPVVMAAVLACVSYAGAQTNEAEGTKLFAPQTPAQAPALKAPYYFQYSLLQMHVFPDYQPYDQGLVKFMFERISTGRYADDYFFFGANSAHPGANATAKHEYDETVGTLYFKYAPCLNLDHVFDTDLVPWVGDTYLTVQMNAGDRMDLSLNSVYLAGVAVDVPDLPNYGRCRIYAMLRHEETMKMTHQVTVMWAQSFRAFDMNWVFAGWGAHWSNDNTSDVIKIEPQLRLRLNSFAGEKNFFYNGVLGIELEASKGYLYDAEKHELCDWKVNPSIFYGIPF